LQIEVQSTTKPACANGSVSSLKLTAAIHVKLVDNQTALNIRDADMECENRLADAELTLKRTAPLDCHHRQHRIPIDQPADTGLFRRFENPSRRDFFQLFLQILGKLDRSREPSGSASRRQFAPGRL
jgi:hypothetical protein